MATARQVERLVPLLDDSRYAVREQAQRDLVQLGIAALPEIRRELATAQSLESRQRLRNVVQALTTLPWERDLTAAMKTAKQSGKSILVFSTIGEVDGFA